MKIRWPDWFVTLLGFFGMPAVTIVFVAYQSFQISKIGSGQGNWLVAFVAVLICLAILAFGIAVSGSDMTDFLVPSVLVFVLAWLLLPIFERSQRKAAQKQFLKTHIHNYPRPLGK